MRLNVKLTDGAPLPKHAKSGDAGMDLTTRKAVTIPPRDSVMVGTGTSVEIPTGYVGLVFPRSGLAGKQGVTLRNCVGVIDSGYRGEIKAPLHNTTDQFRRIAAGERVCQLVVVPYVECECVEVDELSETERGEGGFGSSGTL